MSTAVKAPPPPPIVPMKPWLRWLVIFAIWTLLGLIDTWQTYFFWTSRAEPGENIYLWSIVALGFIEWWSWALLTPVIVWLAHRFPLDRGEGGRLLFHAGMSLVTSLSLIIFFWFVLPHIPGAIRGPISSGQLLELLLLRELLKYILIHWMILGITHGFMFYARFRQQELQATRLEGKLAQAQLQMLKMQLHPHFLFNTLHGISALMHRDVEVADRMISQLGDLLRVALENVGAQEVPLSEELALLEKYVEIERSRLGARLNVELRIEPLTLDAAVPNLLLQPLVENAVRHGIAPLASPGRIVIRSRVIENRLHLMVEDTGAGCPGPIEDCKKKGVGLSNTQARLQHLYGTEHLFQVSPGEPHGFRISIQIPFREISPGKEEPYGFDSSIDRR